MKYVKQVVTKEDGRLMEYYWFDKNPVGADIIRPQYIIRPESIRPQDIICPQNESPHTDE